MRSTRNTKLSYNKAIELTIIVVAAICIPAATGLLSMQPSTATTYITNWCCFVLLFWLIRFLNTTAKNIIESRMSLFSNNYFKRFVCVLLISILLTFIISYAGFSVWLIFINHTNESIISTVIVVMTTVAFIELMQENFLLHKDKADTNYRIEQLNIAKTHAELVALKTQIDPHFMFNSLNTLSYLIVKDSKNAKLYNDSLANVFHYILNNRDKNLVPLHDEIEFISNYFYLLKIRFNASVSMSIEFNSVDVENLFIPPISLQVLLENAIKHNEMNPLKPIAIDITVTSNFIAVKNNVYPKPYGAISSKVGLKNLDNRYKLLTGKNISIYKNETTFIVKLPVLTFKNESINS